MKRFIITLIASAMVFSAAGCGAKPNSSAQVSSAETAEGAHEVVLVNLGLTYTTPSAWAEFEKTNIRGKILNNLFFRNKDCTFSPNL